MHGSQCISKEALGFGAAPVSVGGVIGHKFGGSSVANAERISRVVDILSSRDEAQVVVISAMSGVTDALISLVRQAAAREAKWPEALAALQAKHEEAAKTLLGAAAAPVLEKFSAGCGA
mgnify:CR=1 FL=1